LLQTGPCRRPRRFQRQPLLGILRSAAIKFRPDYPNRPFANKKRKACEWVSHRGLVTTTGHRQQRPSSSSRRHPSATAGIATAICQQARRCLRESPSDPIQDAGAIHALLGRPTRRRLWINKPARRARTEPWRYHHTKPPEWQLRGGTTFLESHRLLAQRHRPGPSPPSWIAPEYWASKLFPLRNLIGRGPSCRRSLSEAFQARRHHGGPAGVSAVLKS